MLLRISTYLLIFISTTLCAQKQIISGEISGADDKAIYLNEFYGSNTIPKDTSLIKNGKFAFEYDEYLSRGFYQIGFSQKDGKVLIIADESIEIKGEAGSLASAQIIGSKENEYFEEYKKILTQSNSGIGQISKKINKARKTYSQDKDRLKSEMKSIKVEYDSLITAQNESYLKLKKEHPKSYVGKMVEYFAFRNTSIGDKYLELDRLQDAELLRGDMFKTKYITYYQHFLDGDAKRLKVKSLELIEKDLPQPGKEVLYCAIIESFGQSDKAFASRIAKAYLTEFPNSIIAKGYYASLPQAPPDIGEEAPDIQLTDPDGNVIALSSLEGQIVLLDFWASWCGPCRRENPNVVKTYNEYKDQGFTVYSVSLDNNRQKWLGAIEKDGLTWNSHVSDLRGWKSAGAALYGVKSIPSTFLLDREGVIIAKNLRGARLENKLKEILSSN